MNFEKSVFYELADGTGTSVVDTLGNGPTGSIQGTTTNIWSNAGCFTISNASGAAGDNAIKIQDSYIDEMMRLDNLSGSIVVMYMLNQPQVPSSGTRAIFSYGNTGSATDGAYALADLSNSVFYSIRGGATSEFGGTNTCESLTASENNTWFSYGFQLDVIDGRVISSSYINGEPHRGCRLFNLEAGLPRVDTAGCGIRLFARSSGASTSTNFMWGGTKLKRVFIGRVSGDQRHNIPAWCEEYYTTQSGTPSFMVE